MTFQVKAEILLANSNWEKNLKKSSKQLEGFGKTTKTISDSIKWAWAGVATLAFGAVGDAIVDVTKKFQEDAQSQRILAKVIDNNVKGHQKLKASVEDNISAWQLMSNVQDDKIRPAYGYLIRATHDVSKSNRLMKISLDLAAGAHIDIGTAASAVGRAYTGNLRALEKLAPGIKNLNDPLGAVEQRFKGIAALSAENDPFAKLSIVMDEFKEKLGKSFMPIIKKFADYVASPEFQKQLDNLAKKFENLMKWFSSKEGQKAMQGWMDDLKTMLKLVGRFLDLVQQTSELLGSSGKRRLDTGKNLSGTNIITGTNIKAVSKDNKSAWADVSRVINNITVYATQASGKDVVNELSKLAIKKGIPLSKLLK